MFSCIYETMISYQGVTRNYLEFWRFAVVTADVAGYLLDSKMTAGAASPYVLTSVDGDTQCGKRVVIDAAVVRLLDNREVLFPHLHNIEGSWGFGMWAGERAGHKVEIDYSENVLNGYGSGDLDVFLNHRRVPRIIYGKQMPFSAAKRRNLTQSQDCLIQSAGAPDMTVTAYKSLFNYAGQDKEREIGPDICAAFRDAMKMTDCPAYNTEIPDGSRILPVHPKNPWARYVRVTVNSDDPASHVFIDQTIRAAGFADRVTPHGFMKRMVPS